MHIPVLTAFSVIRPIQYQYAKMQVIAITDPITGATLFLCCKKGNQASINKKKLILQSL